MLAIGIIISVLMLYFKVAARNNKSRLLSMFICTLLIAIFLIFIYHGKWCIIYIPIITFMGIFISFIFYPLNIHEAYESERLSIPDIYNTINENEIIGNIKVYWFKQSYERILSKVLFAFTSSNKEANMILSELYKNIYYPVSTENKSVVLNHVKSSIDKVVLTNKWFLTKSLNNNPDVYRYVFNVFCCILLIHEEATNRVREINIEKEIALRKYSNK